MAIGTFENNMGGDNNIKLLWENENPTATFRPQTIDIALDEHAIYYVFVNANNAVKMHGLGAVIANPVIGDSLRLSLPDNAKDASTLLITRDATIVANGISFANCYQKLSYSSSAGGTDDNRIIPTAIYELKGVTMI